jgi:hypothetical protein
MAVLVILAWCTLGEVSVGRTERGAKTEKPRPEAKARVTIVFRGLQVFHPDPARQYFEAGILRAPEHKFHIEVLEKSSAGVSSFRVPRNLSGARRMMSGHLSSRVLTGALVSTKRAHSIGKPASAMKEISVGRSTSKGKNFTTSS